MYLCDIPVGQRVKVVAVNTPKEIKKRLADLGLCIGTEVTVIRFAPFNDPIELYLRGFYLGIRRKDAEKILVEKI